MKTNFTQWFLHSSNESKNMYRTLMDRAVALITEQTTSTTHPFSGASHHEIEETVKEMLTIPSAGQKIEDVMEEIQNGIVRNSLWVSHPSAMAHLHCPPVLPSLAAEVIINALNQSMDSWDQSPSATYIEADLINFLTKQIGYLDHADGVFTSGGTQSNYMGLLLARNKACQTYFSINVHKEGLPVEASKLRILCSEHAHFSVQQSAAQLGLGMDAVVKVEVDDKQRLCLSDAKEKIERLREQGLLPFMVVATAGTTDFGSLDCIREIAKLTNEEQLWLHVDAAYGGALLFSHQYRYLVSDLCLADSITIDFHKLYYQSISCGAFFVKDRKDFQQIAYHADYLNSEEDQADGIINLVEKSVQTTKRFDALKLLMTFKLMGTDLLGELIDYTVNLARETALLLKEELSFKVLNDPEINVVLFRYLPLDHREDQAYVDEINLGIQRACYQSGELIMAKTKQNGNVYLKFTMLNPVNSISNMQVHIKRMKKAAEKIEKERGEIRYEYSIHH
ncbi:2,4-diaminobutyrate decarboxylase [Virgibacillus phasianinus]|uniref:2,4-diaminobutyrate decarboxylase n=1 Tax=Virgibacillus phasianinus TaxID=2017483 RepID=A0A220U7E3_9BACI|nr:aspartate aminotransferase family protein [Virgibacillus phasianinus]ASK64059.1 2,4-diaminobutyrate decarboxylase [Virgibacillus phasianinus]